MKSNNMMIFIATAMALGSSKNLIEARELLRHPQDINGSLVEKSFTSHRQELAMREECSTASARRTLRAQKGTGEYSYYPAPKRGLKTWVHLFYDKYNEEGDGGSDDSPAAPSDSYDPPLVPQSQPFDPPVDIEEVCPCIFEWKNHEKYVKCVQRAVRGFNQKRRARIIRKAERSECGKSTVVPPTSTTPTTPTTTTTTSLTTSTTPTTSTTSTTSTTTTTTTTPKIAGQTPCDAYCDGNQDQIHLCHHDAELQVFTSVCLKYNMAMDSLVSSPEVYHCGSCEETLSSAIDSLDKFDNPDDALKSVDPSEMAVVVSAVQMLVGDDVKQLVTEESILSSVFPNANYHLDLHPLRRHLNTFFDWRPSGCDGATSSMIIKVLTVVASFGGVSNPREVASSTIQDLFMDARINSLFAEIYEIADLAWFDGSPFDVLNACIMIWVQLWSFFGLKNIYAAMDTASSTGVDISVFLTMIAISVTNGDPMLSSLEVITDVVNELAQEGQQWINICFLTNCVGEAPLCNDGDLCTVDQNRCDFTTDWVWKCAHNAKVCSPGYSCDPSDGACKPDDFLVPCVAVIDEDSSFGKPNQAELWNQFRSRYPARPFCLLVVEKKSYPPVSPPSNFLSDDLTIDHYEVTRDKGDMALAMDWASMCGLDQFTAANVNWVGLFVDDSGSMKAHEVEASTSKFYSRLEDKGIQVKRVVNKKENWILPFLETLAPEEKANFVQLDGYVFWPSYDSVGSDIEHYELSTLASLAGNCNNDQGCQGFNSNGWLKSQIKPLDQWLKLNDTSKDEGLYIKRQATYSANRRRLLSSFQRSRVEMKWLNWIAQYTVPNYHMSRYDAVQDVAWGVLWSLHKGALNGDLWNPYEPPVKNPFLHSLCNGKQLGPEDTCPANDWRVGIAFDQPIDYTPDELEKDALIYYDTVETALSKTVQAAGFDAESSSYTSIISKCGADKKLKQSWLLRNHLIGLSNMSNKIKNLCQGNTPQFWCEHIGSVRVLLQSLVSGGCQNLGGYVFWPHFNSHFDDDQPHGTAKLWKLWEDCNADQFCKGFNTEGVFKRTMRPVDEWVKLPNVLSRCSGLYIKTPDAYIVNNNKRLPMEVKYLDYIAQWTIPNLKETHYDAIRLIAWGTLWSVYVGALNGNLWGVHPEYNTVSNPFLHSLCKRYDNVTVQLPETEPTRYCETDDWQVGIAFDNVKDYTLAELKKDALKYYDTVDIAIVQTVEGAGFKENNMGNLIAKTTNERLKKSWLLRNHLIGLSNKSKKVKEQCESSDREEWCDYFGDVAVLLQSLVGGECIPIQLNGYDFYPSEDSPPENPPLGGSQLNSYSLLAIQKECDEMAECKGFTTNGFLKKQVSPRIKLLGPSKCQGLYVKRVMTSIEKVLDIARKEYERGVVEDVGKNQDSGGHIAKYLGSAKPAAWSTAFVSWVFKEAGFPLNEGGQLWVPSMQNWLKDPNGCDCWRPQLTGHNPGTTAKPGDLVLFGIPEPNHIGIVEEIRIDSTITTIEGDEEDALRRVHRTKDDQIIGYGRKFPDASDPGPSFYNPGEPLNYMSRSMWGAADWNYKSKIWTNCKWGPVAMNSAQKVVIHHAASRHDASLTGMQRWHQCGACDKTNPEYCCNDWCDLGYHFLVDYKGIVYQGRQFQDDHYGEHRNKLPAPTELKLAQGSHVKGHNKGTIGLNLIGCFHPGYCEKEVKELTPISRDSPQYKSLIKIAAFVCEAYGIEPNADTFKGHKDLQENSCPGDNVYAFLPDIIADVRVEMGR